MTPHVPVWSVLFAAAAALCLPDLARGAGAAPAPAEDRELAVLAEWMTGDFDTFAQVARDESAGAAYKHMRAVMHIVPATIPGLSAPGARTFYVEQAAADTQDKPYRQRVYLLTRIDGRAINRIYRLKTPEQFVGAHRNPELLAALTPDALQLEEGCDLVWTRVSHKLFTGVAGGDKTCRTTWRGASFVVSQVEMTPTTLTSLDQGFAENGAHKWGPPPGAIGHIFTRR